MQNLHIFMQILTFLNNHYSYLCHQIQTHQWDWSNWELPWI